MVLHGQQRQGSFQHTLRARMIKTPCQRKAQATPPAVSRPDSLRLGLTRQTAQSAAREMSCCQSKVPTVL